MHGADECDVQTDTSNGSETEVQLLPSSWLRFCPSRAPAELQHILNHDKMTGTKWTSRTPQKVRKQLKVKNVRKSGRGNEPST
jgi:hypothetical protein